MTQNRECLCEYERYNRRDVLLGDDSPYKIIGCGKVKLLLKDGRIRTLHGVFHIPYLYINMIYVSTMRETSVNTVFEKEIYKMVQG